MSRSWEVHAPTDRGKWPEEEVCMMKRKKLLACILVPLYVSTWIGGWISHAQELRARAQTQYNSFEQLNREMNAGSGGAATDRDHVKLRKGGPATYVDWCIPVLPGVLLVDSGSTFGPDCGWGGLKIVLYYGFGSKELCTLVGWIS